MMTLDPDLWLYSRLALGRGWRLLGAAIIVVAIATAGWITLPLFEQPQDGGPDPRFLPLAFLLLMIGPARAVGKLLDLETGGLLDQTRLTGRPPRRVLAMFLIGSTWPFLIASLILLMQHVRVQQDPRSLLIAALVFAAAVAVSLLAYGALPAGMTTDSRFFTPLLLIAGFVSLNFLMLVKWIRQGDFDDSNARVTEAIVAAALPLAWWLACRRLDRPSARGLRVGAGYFLGAVSRLIPRAGPPELNRQFRCSLLSGGTLATILVAPLSIVLIAMRSSAFDANQRDIALTLIPFLVWLIAWFAVSSTVRAAIDSGTFDLARVTPQRAETIALGWYAGIALPYWITTLLTGAALLVVGDQPTVTVLVVALPLMIPAVSLAEGLQRRRSGAYLWLPLLAAAMFATYSLPRPALPYSIFRRLLNSPGVKGTTIPSDVIDAAVRALPDYEWRRLAPPFPLDLKVVLPAFATVISLGAAAGRLRRVTGPALAGPAAAAAACAVVIGTRFLPLITFPRLLPGVLALFASFAAEETRIPTPPWTRVAVVTSAAFGAVVLVTREAAIGWSGSLSTAVAAASALGAAILVHEMTWQTPVVSLALRFGLFLGVQGWSWTTMRSMVSNQLAAIRALAELPAALSPREVTLLAAAFGATAVAHTLMRKRNAAIASEGRAR